MLGPIHLWNLPINLRILSHSHYRKNYHWKIPISFIPISLIAANGRIFQQVCYYPGGDPMGSQVCSRTLQRFRSTPSQWNGPLFLGQTPFIILLQVNSLTLNNLHYILLALWKHCQTSPSKRENQNLGTVKMIFV